MPWQRDAQGVWRRPMSDGELGFYLDGLHHAVAKTYTSVTCTGAFDLFDLDRMQSAWARTCRQHLLLSATVDFDGDKAVGRFVVKEDDLHGRHGDVTTWPKNTADLQAHIVSGPNDLLDPAVRLARLFVSRSGDEGAFDISLVTDHCVGDQSGRLGALRTFFTELTAPSETLPDLDARLELCRARNELSPISIMSQAQRRWRETAAKVIMQRRARPVGGKSLPRLRQAGFGDLPSPADIHRSLSPALTAQVVAGARALKHPFHHAFLVCASIALARTLYRLRAKGKLSAAEFDQLLLEPFHVLGTVNLRASYGYDASIAANCIGGYTCTLPTLVSSQEGVHVPSWEELCSRKRFEGRLRMSERALKDYLEHPLLHDFAVLGESRFIRMRPAYPGNLKQALGGMSFSPAFVGGSLGNIEPKLPSSWPGGLKLEDKAKLRGLRCRPGELNIGCRTWQGEMLVAGAVDVATYDEDTVQMLFDEIVGALTHYLAPQADDLSTSS